MELEVIAPGQERAPLIERALGIRLAAVHERAADVALGGTGERDQPGEGCRCQPAPLHAGHAALLTFEVGAREEPREVAVALLALAEERQAARFAPLAVLAHCEIDPDDGLDAP